LNGDGAEWCTWRSETQHLLEVGVGVAGEEGRVAQGQLPRILRRSFGKHRSNLEAKYVESRRLRCIVETEDSTRTADINVERLRRMCEVLLRPILWKNEWLLVDALERIDVVAHLLLVTN